MLDLNVPLQLMMCCSKHATCITLNTGLPNALSHDYSILLRVWSNRGNHHIHLSPSWFIAGGWLSVKSTDFLVWSVSHRSKCSQATGCSFLICSLNSSSFSKVFPHLSQSSKIEIEEDLEDGLEKGKWGHKEKMRNKSIKGRTKSERWRLEEEGHKFFQFTICLQFCSSCLYCRWSAGWTRSGLWRPSWRWAPAHDLLGVNALTELQKRMRE